MTMFHTKHTILFLLHTTTNISAFTTFISTLPPKRSPIIASSSSSSLESNPNRRDLLKQSLSFATIMSASSSPTTSSAQTEQPTTQKSVIRWGIIGLGDVCAKKSGPAFWKCTNSELVAVMRRTPGAAQAWVDENVPSKQQCRGYDDIDAFLNHSSPGGLDAVYVATPPGGHLEVARKVAEKGLGLACYVEKPVGRCGWETVEMVRLFEEKGVPFYSAYISRAYERTEAVKDLLRQGVIGERVMSVEYVLRGTGGARGMEGEELPWRLVAAKAGGGLIMDVGCHLVDRIDYLLGPLVNVKGRALNRKSPRQDVEDYVELQAEIGPSSWAAIDSVGAKVECVWDFAAEEQDACDELVITGPKGSLRMAAMSPSLPVMVLDSKGEMVRTLTFETPEHTAQPLVQSITDELRGAAGVKCPSRGENAIRSSKVLDSILGDYYGGRDDEFWLRPETWPGKHQA